ncbi:MAG: heat-inducible transcriptional repressor HrcA [Gemmatimonadota bacterium]|nr:heat-inducible transcriptional repressor HrcA [Gemmatimonadota bacterium]
MSGETLSEREHTVLEAVIRTYVETAEPAGSRVVARRFQLGISPATVRNTMSDLEEKGYLYHPHTSAGRVPTQRAYRFFVDSLIEAPRLSAAERLAIRGELAGPETTGVEQVVRRAAQVLGLITQELGIAIDPQLDSAALDRLELIPLSEGKVLLVLALRSAGVRTVYVDIPAHVAPAALASVARVLNERLAGLPLQEIRATLPERLRDSLAGDDPHASELLNVFLQSADEWLRVAPGAGSELHLGRASVLALQPEFASGERLKELIELTERRDLLREVLGERIGPQRLQVTIGQEHGHAHLASLAVVTSEYRVGALKGVIGVIGPTRMPYERVIALVESTSLLMTEILE